MIHLTTLEQFDILWRGAGPKKFLIWFSAAWCGPCQRMDKKLLEETAKEANLPFYYSDFVVNEEIATRCNITRFPTFAVCTPGEIIATNADSDTIRIVLFLKRNKATN